MIDLLFAVFAFCGGLFIGSHMNEVTVTADGLNRAQVSCLNNGGLQHIKSAEISAKVLCRNGAVFEINN